MARNTIRKNKKMRLKLPPSVYSNSIRIRCDCGGIVICDHPMRVEPEGNRRMVALCADCGQLIGVMITVANLSEK